MHPRESRIGSEVSMVLMAIRVSGLVRSLRGGTLLIFNANLLQVFRYFLVPRGGRQFAGRPFSALQIASAALTTYFVADVYHVVDALFKLARGKLPHIGWPLLTHGVRDSVEGLASQRVLVKVAFHVVHVAVCHVKL